MGGAASHYRLRVELTDRPGVFAAAAAALAGLGVDLLAIDVLEENGPTVIDELVVALPPGVPVTDVEDALTVAGAMHVLSSAAGGPLQDPIVRTLQRAVTALTSPWDATENGSALAAMAYADAGRLLDVREAEHYPLAQRALATQVPAAGRAVPGASPLPITTGWVLWAAPAGPDPAVVAVVGRRLNVRFSAAEAARLRAFATLLSTVGMLSPAASCQAG